MGMKVVYLSPCIMCSSGHEHIPFLFPFKEELKSPDSSVSKASPSKSFSHLRIPPLRLSKSQPQFLPDRLVSYIVYCPKTVDWRKDLLEISVLSMISLALKATLLSSSFWEKLFDRKLPGTGDLTAFHSPPM